jgi:hypothetical protein
VAKIYSDTNNTKYSNCVVPALGLVICPLKLLKFNSTVNRLFFPSVDPGIFQMSGQIFLCAFIEQVSTRRKPMYLPIF